MTERPWELVESPMYFRCILGNMTRADTARAVVTARFGLSGNGARPNYQIETPNGMRLSYLGSSHAIDRHAPASGYEESQLSTQRFTYTDVQTLLAGCLRRSR